MFHNPLFQQNDAIVEVTSSWVCVFCGQRESSLFLLSCLHSSCLQCLYEHVRRSSCYKVASVSTFNEIDMESISEYDGEGASVQNVAGESEHEIMLHVTSPGDISDVTSVHSISMSQAGALCPFSNSETIKVACQSCDSCCELRLISVPLSIDDMFHYVSPLILNHLHEKYVEARAQGTVDCSNCEGSAVVWCHDCSMSLCSACTNSLHKLKAFHRHRRCGPLSERPIFNPLSKCAGHAKKAVGQCAECLCPVCSICLRTTGHTLGTKPSDEMICGGKELQQQVEAQLQQRVLDVERVLASTLSETSRKNAEIEACHKMIRTYLNDWLSEMYARVALVSEDHAGACREQLLTCRALLTEVNNRDPWGSLEPASFPLFQLLQSHLARVHQKLSAIPAIPAAQPLHVTIDDAALKAALQDLSQCIRVSTEPPLPRIIGVSPTAAPRSGGVTVRLRFTECSAEMNTPVEVKFGGYLCPAARFVDKTTIECITPMLNKVGKVDITVAMQEQNVVHLRDGFTAEPDLSWIERSDAFEGMRPCTCNPLVVFAVAASNVHDPQKTYDAPEGYRMATSQEGRWMFRSSAVASGALVYANQGGWQNTEWKGLDRVAFLFADSQETGAYKHAAYVDDFKCHTDWQQGSLPEQRFAGFVLLRTRL